MQTVLVLITFFIALSYLLKKFVWNPIFYKQKHTSTIDGAKTKCGKSDCGCN